MEKVGLAFLLAIVTACSDGSSAGGSDSGGSGSGGSGSGASGAGGAVGFSAPPTCFADGAVEAPASPVSGKVVGARLRAALCSGGAKAYVEVTPSSLAFGSRTLFVVSLPTNAHPDTRFTFELPSDATQGSAHALMGMTGPAPGSYSSDTDCGDVGVCAMLPIPADLDCQLSAVCPPGCALQGVAFAPTCLPVPRSLCYQATAAQDCLGEPTAPRGSWSLTLTSVEPYASDMGTSDKRFVAHGSLTADLLNTDGSDDSAQLSVAF